MAGFETQGFPSTPPQDMQDVWDLDGKHHRMTRANVNDMVTHLGWFRAVPQVAGKVTEKIVVVVAKKNAPPADAKPEDTEEVDLHSLDLPALIAFADEHFDMQFDAAVSKEFILNAILTEKE